MLDHLYLILEAVFFSARVRRTDDATQNVMRAPTWTGNVHAVPKPFESTSELKAVNACVSRSSVAIRQA